MLRLSNKVQTPHAVKSENAALLKQQVLATSNEGTEEELE